MKCSKERENLYPGLSDAFMLMAPDHKVKEPGQVALSDAVLGVLRVRHSVLVQDKDVEPGIDGVAGAVCWTHPARTHRANGMSNASGVCGWASLLGAVCKQIWNWRNNTLFHPQGGLIHNNITLVYQAFKVAALIVCPQPDCIWKAGCEHSGLQVDASVLSLAKHAKRRKGLHRAQEQAHNSDSAAAACICGWQNGW